jgi:hypothetical protein
VNVQFEQIVGFVTGRFGAKRTVLQNHVRRGESVIGRCTRQAVILTVVHNVSGRNVQTLIVFRHKNRLVAALLLLWLCVIVSGTEE